MASPIVLDSNVHGNLRIKTGWGAEYGDSIHMAPVIADELPRLVLEYPVSLVRDDDSDRFQLTALLGFDPGENLFLDGALWNAMYVPMHLRRQPFTVGIAGEAGAEATPENTIITIDTDSPRVSDTEGERLFDADGKVTPFLQSINDLLAHLMSGISVTEAFITTLGEFDLIEPATLDVAFASGEQRKFEGLYTVSDEKLRALDDAKLRTMYDRGYLQASYLLLTSIGQFQKLIKLKDWREAG